MSFGPQPDKGRRVNFSKSCKYQPPFKSARSSRWVDGCINYLSTPLHAAASDTLLVAYGKLTTILDEINSSLLSNDQVNDLGLQDQRTQLVMKTLLKQLDSWLSEIDSEILRGDFHSLPYVRSSKLTNKVLFL